MSSTGRRCKSGVIGYLVVDQDGIAAVCWMEQSANVVVVGLDCRVASRRVVQVENLD